MFKISEFLAKLGKPNGKPENAAKLAAAIAELETERDKAQAALSTASERRTTMLLADDDAALDHLDREIEAAHRMVERIDLALPGLRERHAIARDKLRMTRIAELRAANAEAFTDLDAAVSAAMAANQRAVEVHERARRELGEDGARIFVPSTVYLAPLNADGYAAWRGFTTDAIDPQRPEKPGPQPVLVKPKPAPRIATPPVSRLAKPTPAGPAAIREIPKPDAEGRVPVVILQGGYPDASGKPLKAGARVMLPLADAKSALERGTADLVEG